MTQIDTDKLRALAEKATPGPYDTMPGSMIRALRDDLAVPIFESRCVIWDPANEGPTVRDSRGVVQMRKGTEGAKTSQGMRREHANVELVAYLLNSVPAILAMAEDAARYHWLRDHSCPPHNFYISVPDEFSGVRYGPSEVDDYIDAARQALAAPGDGE